jgi:hypothetical protein
MPFLIKKIDKKSKINNLMVKRYYAYKNSYLNKINLNKYIYKLNFNYPDILQLMEAAIYLLFNINYSYTNINTYSLDIDMFFSSYNST